MYRVHAVLFGDAGESGAVERHAIEMPLEGRFFRGREIDDAFGFVNGIHLADFPIAFGELRELLAGQVIEIEMAVAGAFTRPEKAIGVLEKIKVVADIDPVLIFFGKQRCCSAAW